MATEEIRWDDIDFRSDPPVRTPATETVVFAFGDSGPMTLDLSEAHAKEISEAFAPWLAAASPVVVATTTRTRATRTARADDAPERDAAYHKEFRAWCADRGYEIERYTRGNGKPGAYKYDPARLAEYDAWLVSVRAGTASPAKPE